MLGAAGTYTTGKENGNGRFVVVGYFELRDQQRFSASTATAICS